MYTNRIYIYIYIYIYRRKYPINNHLKIPTQYRSSVTIRDIKKLYIHKLLVI